MRKIVIVFLGCAFGVQAQEGGKIKSVAIPRENKLPKFEAKLPELEKNSADFSITKPFEPRLFKVPPKVYDAPKTDNPVTMTPQQSDLNVGKQYADKLNKTQFNGNSEGKVDSRMFRRNQFFGEFKTKSTFVILNYRDFGLVDGDNIRIWSDGKVIVDRLTMEGGFDTIQIGLIEGINKIEIEALNEGVYSPNTGEFRFIDDKGQVLSSDKWDISTNFRATFIFVREK